MYTIQKNHFQWYFLRSPRFLSFLLLCSLLFGLCIGGFACTIDTVSSVDAVADAATNAGPDPDFDSRKLIQAAVEKAILPSPPVRLEWITLPSGSFTMGCVGKDAACAKQEKGRHRRRTKVASFQMMKTEVTVVMYKQCVDAGACTEPESNKRDDAAERRSTRAHKPPNRSCNWGDAHSARMYHPVNCVAWNQAVEYCKYVGGRLPSAAEWEYAAKSGGRNQKYPWGNEKASCTYAVMDDDETDAGCGDPTSLFMPSAITILTCSKTLGKSAQGICDLAGNVAEWIDVRNEGRTQETRGGSAYDDFTRLRASALSQSDGRESSIGFRCVK